MPGGIARWQQQVFSESAYVHLKSRCVVFRPKLCLQNYSKVCDWFCYCVFTIVCPKAHTRKHAHRWLLLHATLCSPRQPCSGLTRTRTHHPLLYRFLPSSHNRLTDSLEYLLSSCTWSTTYPSGFQHFGGTFTKNNRILKQTGMTQICLA